MFLEYYVRHNWYNFQPGWNNFSGNYLLILWSNYSSYYFITCGVSHCLNYFHNLQLFLSPAIIPIYLVIVQVNSQDNPHTTTIHTLVCIGLFFVVIHVATRMSLGNDFHLCVSGEANRDTECQVHCGNQLKTKNWLVVTDCNYNSI